MQVKLEIWILNEVFILKQPFSLQHIACLLVLFFFAGVQELFSQNEQAGVQVFQACPFGDLLLTLQISVEIRFGFPSLVIGW
jgi:hypothetical protein